MCSVMDDKWNFQCPEKKIYIGIYRNVSFLIVRLKFPTASRVYGITWWIYENILSIQWFATDITQNLLWVDGKQFGCKIKVAGRCDSRYSILSSGAITKICFIFINHIYLTLRSGFNFILINTIYTNEADFRPDTKWKNTVPWITPFAILFWRSDCYPGTGPIFCAILVTYYWAHITFPHIYNVMMYTLAAVGNLIPSIEKWQIPIDYLVWL